MAVICEPKFNIGASSIFDADFEACSDEAMGAFLIISSRLEYMNFP